MYDELVKRLREEAECPDNYQEDSNLMREAAEGGNMSILIRGMELPQTGVYEIAVDNTWGKDKTVMTLYTRKDNGMLYVFGSYELVPVPPHGRLIDADALYTPTPSCTFKAEEE